MVDKWETEELRLKRLVRIWGVAVCDDYIYQLDGRVSPASQSSADKSPGPHLGWTVVSSLSLACPLSLEEHTSRHLKTSRTKQRERSNLWKTGLGEECPSPAPSAGRSRTAQRTIRAKQP